MAIENKMLADLERAFTENVHADHAEQFRKVVTAGLHLMFDDQTHSHMDLVKNPESRKDPANTIAKGISGLMIMMNNQHGGQMKEDVLINAGLVLMVHAMDFAERSFGIQWDGDNIGTCMTELTNKFFTAIGADPKQVAQAIKQGHEDITAELQKQGVSTVQEYHSKMGTKPQTVQ
jgi:hypothetical protein